MDNNNNKPQSRFYAIVFGCFLVFASCFATPAQAQYRSRPVIGEIIVDGVQRIEPQTVRSYMLVRPGDLLDMKRVDASLKSLFATGLFADVSMRLQRNNLLVTVVENPIVNRRVFEGNNRINDEALEDEVSLSPRSIYTRAKVQSDVQRIIEIYRRSGRFAVKVDPKIITRPQNRLDLIYEIDEGPSTYIRRINFVGNRFYDNARLAEEILSREERWYRFFSQMDSFDPDRMTYDRELLRRFYVKNGFADFRVTSAVAEMTPDRQAFFVTFTVEEGPRYKFGTVEVQNTLPELDVAALEDQVSTVTGDWYNAEEMENTVQELTDAAGSQGYAFVDVTPVTDKNSEDRTVNLVYKIMEGPRVFVDRINISGNVRTLDRVIRREIKLVEGDAFNTAKLRRSRKRLADLNFFENVEIDPRPSASAPDRTIIDVAVQEKSTGELSLGVGWSTTEGAMIEAGIHERNLLGKGQQLSLTTSLAQKASQIDLSFTEPYFLNRRLKAGFDLFRITRDLQSQSSYDWQSYGESLRLGWDYTEELSQGVKYTIRQDKIENVDTDASEFIRNQSGSSVLSMVSQGLFYDKRDSKVDPREGYYASLNNDLAGLGGDQRFLRADISAAHYFPVKDKSVFKIGAKLGYIIGLADDVDLNNRYFLGGTRLRGFETGGVSARDKTTRDALGGNYIANSTAELVFPMGLPNELGVKGKLFVDAGFIGEPDKLEEKSNVDYDSSPRASVGTGLVWKSPMGPINIDLAFPFLKEEYDQTENFRLNFGTTF